MHVFLLLHSYLLQGALRGTCQPPGMINAKPCWPMAAPTRQVGAARWWVAEMKKWVRSSLSRGTEHNLAVSNFGIALVVLCSDLQSINQPNIHMHARHKGFHGVHAEQQICGGEDGH
ncbi:hypothetical protein ABPG77_003692 [Micractinium sp. CCAP 211/92]